MDTVIELIDALPPYNAGERIGVDEAKAASLVVAGRARYYPPRDVATEGRVLDASVYDATQPQPPVTGQPDARTAEDYQTMTLADLPEGAVQLPPASDDPQWSEGTGATMVPVQPDADGTTRFAGEPAQDE